jgi:hypothetical protein
MALVHFGAGRRRGEQLWSGNHFEPQTMDRVEVRIRRLLDKLGSPAVEELTGYRQVLDFNDIVEAVVVSVGFVVEACRVVTVVGELENVPKGLVSTTRSEGSVDR